jgi:hypothetical protein
VRFHSVLYFGSHCHRSIATSMLLLALSETTCAQQGCPLLSDNSPPSQFVSLHTLEHEACREGWLCCMRQRPDKAIRLALSALIRHKCLSMDGTHLPYGLFHRLWKTSVLQDGTLTSACCPVSSYWHSMDFSRCCLKEAVGGAVTRQGVRPQNGDDSQNVQGPHTRLALHNEQLSNLKSHQCFFIRQCRTSVP